MNTGSDNQSPDNATVNKIHVSDPAVRALLPGYLDRRRADSGQIEQLVADDQFDDIRILAHNMRGSGAAYGVDLVSAVGEKMEAAAKARDGAAIAVANAELAAFLKTASVD